MPGRATRTGIDSAGGLLLASFQKHVFIDGATWAIVGDAIAPHGSAPHDAATMVAGSTFVSIDAVPAVIAGNLASCADVATGSGPVVVES